MVGKSGVKDPGLKIPGLKCHATFPYVLLFGQPESSYSGAHISWHKLFLAGNQSNHQNLVPSMLTYKF
jgi:hypothetical protein